MSGSLTASAFHGPALGSDGHRDRRFVEDGAEMLRQHMGPIQFEPTLLREDFGPRDVEGHPPGVKDFYCSVPQAGVHLPAEAVRLVGCEQRDSRNDQLQRHDRSYKSHQTTRSGHSPENASIMRMAPGPMMTMNSAGKIQTKSGKRILTVTF